MVHLLRIEENTLHIDINRRFLCLLLHSRVKWSDTRTHAHTLHKTSFNGASLRIALLFFICALQRINKAIERNHHRIGRVQCNKQLFICENHLKWLKRSTFHTRALSMKLNLKAKLKWMNKQNELTTPLYRRIDFVFNPIWLCVRNKTKKNKQKIKYKTHLVTETNRKQQKHTHIRK